MVWMITFCFCCTVRLGIIFSSLLSIVMKTGELALYVINIEDVVPKLVRIIENDPELSDNPISQGFNNFLKLHPEEVKILYLVKSGGYLVSCLLCIYAAYKLNKYFLLPFIVLQFVRVIEWLGVHVIAMLIIKKDVNLGVLIGLTIAGGFVFLLFGYQWCGAVGMYQIIGLVNSAKYKRLYGDDPFYPIDLMAFDPDGGDSVENVKIFRTPNYDEVDQLKSENLRAAVASSKRHYAMYQQHNMGTIATIGNQNGDANDLRRFWHMNELAPMPKTNRVNRSIKNSVGYF